MEQPCILIVSEDYSRIREALRDAGYSTAGVPDPESAREVFESMKPSLVVIDDELARTTHRSLPYYVRVLSGSPRTPLLAIGDKANESIARAPAEAYDAYFTRPLDLHALIAAVRQLMPAAPPTP